MEATGTDYEKLYLDFAEHVRRKTSKILSAAAGGHTQKAGELAAILCQEAADIVQQAKMQTEVGSVDRYDLSALNVDPTTPTDSESPFEDE